jgi:AAA15 family ATPase/GTPase
MYRRSVSVLRSFRVANHRSIRDEQELLLLPAYDKNRSAVPVAAVFGANASGKSNLLDALAFMQTAVRTSYRSWEPGTGIPRHPFRLDPKYINEESLFAVDVTLEGVRSTYGFTVDNEQVREEWLYTYPQGRRRIIFERDDGRVRLGSTLADHRSREATLNGLTRANALFLSTAAHANQAEMMPLYDWFRVNLRVLDSLGQAKPENIVSRLAADTDRIDVVDLARVADLGIADILVERPDELMRQLNAKSTLVFLQGKHSVPLRLAEQSAGTRAWISLLTQVLPVLESGYVLVVDEIDTSLHPRLTARLIELFRDGRTNSHNAQLVFVTHDTSLLGTSFGRPVLERDQIWFTQKDDEGATSLFPLTDFHPRKEENTERRYLGGSYGAVPAVFSDSLVEAYLASRPEPADGPA